MALTILQSGTTLQLLDASGGLTTLALPTGVTLRQDVPPRWAVYGRNVILVNTPSQPLMIDATGTVRLLSPKAPRLAPVLAANGSSTLTGTFRAKMTFVTQDALGNVLSESDYSPISNSVTIASAFLQASNLDISPDQITGRRLYRTTDNGAVYFQWVDLDGNTITQVQDDLADAGLSIVGAPILGTPPRLTTIAEFRGRLFGVGDTDIDDLRYTEAGLQYAWPADNVLPIPAIGSDAFGVVAVMPRREALGVGRRNMLVQITGTGTEDTNGVPDLNPVILSRELGVESQETVCVFRDTAYFLWKDGVYTWNSGGITCISDGSQTSAGYTGPVAGKGNVRSWFVTNSYFNRDLFTLAFAQIVPGTPKYRLFLAAAGSTIVDHWVEYDIQNQTWWGPHKTDLFAPTCAFQRTNVANTPTAIIGSVDSVYAEQETRTDGASTPIVFDTLGKKHDGDEPDLDKFFGEVSVWQKDQAQGVLQVVSRTGNLETVTSHTQYADMTQTRQRLGRLGAGKHTQLEFVQKDVAQDVTLYGYDVDPINVIGRR